jgi:hypothetical protein
MNVPEECSLLSIQEQITSGCTDKRCLQFVRAPLLRRHNNPQHFKAVFFLPPDSRPRAYEPALAESRLRQPPRRHLHQFPDFE